MQVSTSSPIGTRVSYTGGTLNDLYNGDLGTIVGSDRYNVAILMDDSRGRRVRNLCGADAHWTTSGSDFDVVTDASLPVGTTLTITDTDAYFHDFLPGTTVTVVEQTPEEATIRENSYGHEETLLRVIGRSRYSSDDRQWVKPEHYTVLPSVPMVETLESFKVKFLTLAVERAAENGGSHPEQVKNLLDEFARSEFLDPSSDLDTFKKRVVALAFEGKRRHGWCPEPERFLSDLGLDSLLPVTKSITVVMTVEVSGESTLRRSGWRDLARDEAARRIAEDKWNLSVPTGAYTAENNI